MFSISNIIKDCFGPDIEVTGSRPVSGGDINEAYMAALSDGRKVFLKVNSKDNAGFFEAERTGLEAIRETGTIHVPEVLSSGISGRNAYLVMEYLDAGPKKVSYWERFGRELAALHRADPSGWTPGGCFGFTENNYIGAGRQINTVSDSWLEFFRSQRLEVQFKRALHYFDYSGRKAMQSLLDHLDRYLIEPEFPSLLHGDLWGGNFVTGPDGFAWLIDPAVYVGHAEADLAMTELFGGFSPAFYDAYKNAGPLQNGYADRRDLYNLYHLLNHLNLFGGGYYGSVIRIIKRYAP